MLSANEAAALRPGPALKRQADAYADEISGVLVARAAQAGVRSIKCQVPPVLARRISERLFNARYDVITLTSGGTPQAAWKWNGQRITGPTFPRHLARRDRQHAHRMVGGSAAALGPAAAG
ncbi:hypothetical protein [Deinococcus hopiensis]|uniref:Uncharacterized protein n=1 Tax=Deinococcus hopiensis KR-140 TaxID=695939 RepID=A0A1W1UXP8_9DEIO|nr:hypothetical protein [Deinococcus hopiensis]SMB85885.1 hypothetical protein SAMN00790413_03587 [Deinococcus hopiensis KR-140]